MESTHGGPPEWYIYMLPLQQYVCQESCKEGNVALSISETEVDGAPTRRARLPMAAGGSEAVPHASRTRDVGDTRGWMYSDTLKDPRAHGGDDWFASGNSGSTDHGQRRPTTIPSGPGMTA